MYTADTVVHRVPPRPAGRPVGYPPAYPTVRPVPPVLEPTLLVTPLLVTPRPDRPVARRPRVRSRHRWLRLTGWIAIATGVIVGTVLVGSWFLQQREAVPETTAVGSCVARTGADGIATVGCADPAAQFTVLSRVDGRTQAQAAAVCAGVPGATTTSWKGAAGGTGAGLCLAPAARTAPA